MQSAPQIHIKRKPCKGTFERANLQQIPGIPESEIMSVIDKVELVSGKFKFRKVVKIMACIYFLLVLTFIGLSVARAAMGAHGGQRGPWGHHGVAQRGPGNHGGPSRGPQGYHHGPMGQGFRRRHGFGGHHKFRMMKHFMKKFARRFHRGFRQGFRGMKHGFGHFGKRFRGGHKRFNRKPHHQPGNKKEHPAAPVSDLPAQIEPAMIPTDPNNKPTGEVTIQVAPSVLPIPGPVPTVPSSIKDPEAPTPVQNGAGPILPTSVPSDARQGPADVPRKPHHPGQPRPDFQNQAQQNQNEAVPPQDARGPHPPRPESHGQGTMENKLPKSLPGGPAQVGAPGQSSPGFPGYGERRDRRHRKGKVAKILLIFVIFPLLFLLGMRCKARRIAKKVKALLDIENRYFGAKYGYIWQVDKKLTELTLVPVNPVPQVAEPQVGQGYHMPYPPMMMVPHHAPPMMPPHQGAPLFTENSPRQAPSSPRQGYGAPRGGYQRVSLDDSTVGYTYK